MSTSRKITLNSQCDNCLSISLSIETKIQNHPLTLFGKFITFICDFCGKEGKSMPYLCGSTCGFWAHLNCASFPRMVKHMRHKHPLILTNSIMEDHYEHRVCQLCVKHVDKNLGVYYCSSCDYVAHLDCATDKKGIDENFTWKSKGKETTESINMPKWERTKLKYQLEIKRSYHEHNLKLTDELENYEICDGPPLKVKFIDHPLTLFGKLISFTCDCCGKDGNSMPYLCGRNCGFWVHHNCASLPRMVKSIRHKHPLNFTNSIEADDSEQRLCQLCVKRCSRCDYVAHLDCAMNKEDMDETFMQKFKRKYPIESIIMLEYEDLKIKHFGHEHDLKLTKELENYEICDGCIQPIFPPFYSCAQCNFFLHKSCVELPTKMRHPLHQHPLILRLRRPKLGMCNACSCLSNGLTYVCNACNFSLDVSCSLIPERLTHDGHKHPLIFSSSTSTEKCSACNSESKIFRRSRYEFTLNFKCATLPHTVKYEQHEHLFTLHYTVEDNSGEYYCDIYCDYPAHPHCIFGYAKIDKEDFRNIKFGVTCTYYIHQHPLTLVRETMDQPLCDECGKPCHALAYQCTSCDFNIHQNCFTRWENDMIDFHP
ncbi:hypothetical protein ACB092_03G049900 [Castanea dentata]